MALKYLSGNRLSTRRLNNFNATVTYPGAAADLNYGQTTLLLHGDGTNGAQNNTFLDGSPNAFTVTRNGNATQGTFSPFSRAEGYWSNYFSGSSQYLTSSSSQIIPASTTYTIEAWIFCTNLSSDGSVVVSQGSSGDSARTQVNVQNAGLIFQIGSASASTGTGTLPANQWCHIAVSASSGTVTLFINGKSFGSTSGFGTPQNTTLQIGNNWVSSYFGGYISNVRISNIARYSSNFTPQTTPFVSDSNTVLLACQSNRFKDNSTNAYTFTATGSPQVQTLTPFEPTTAYSAATNGGSGYFDGSGDYLSATLTGQSPGSSAFTYECWIYPTLSQTFGVMNTRSGDTSDGFDWSVATNGSSSCSYTGTVFLSSSAGAVRQNSWNHMAIVYDGSGTWTLYINGVSSATRSASQTFTSTTFNLGVTAIAGNPALGYFGGFRYTKSAVYTGAFTPPTAPLTAITNTQLLLNFQNAGIIDNTQSNNLETIGNVSISTTQKKFGTASMYFDGNSSYLKCPSNPNVAFGTGDFTVEAWIYIASPSDSPIFDSRSAGLGTNGFTLTAFSSTVIRIFTSSVLISATVANYSSTWTHVAVVKSNGTTTLYVNGVAGGTTTSLGDLTNNTVVIGGGRYGGGGDTSITTSLNGYIDDFRITKGIARYLYNFIPPTKTFPDYGTLPTSPSNDSYFGSTSLLLHGDGSSGTQNQTFLDSSTNAFTITRNGNATQGTFSPFSRADGYWSNYFNGNNLTISSNAAFQPGTGDFTIEAWVYFTANSSMIIAVYTGVSFYTTSSGYLAVALDSSAELLNSGGTAVPLNQWTHVAVTRSGTSLKLWQNGINIASTTNSTNFAGSTVTIAAYAGNTYPLTGYISNLRFVKGTAVYSSNFTVPTSPLTAISGTSLLTCQSNRFKDNSTNAFAITTSGSPQVQPFTPFEPTAAYSAATNGGSAYFDGSGDYLSIPDNAAFNLSGGTYTIEGWINPNGNYSAYRAIIAKRVVSSSSETTAWQTYLRTSTGVFSFFNGTNYESSVTPVANAWNYFAAVYDGTNINLYLNGVRVLQSAITNSNISAPVSIGSYPPNSEDFNGYISNLRITKGAALYSGTTMTVPTAPLTTTVSSGSVSLLCNFTNAGIIDNTASNVLETGGNAQASAVQYKYGTGSMYFPGSSYLLSSVTPNFALGSDDFTVEYWLYLNSTAYQQTVMGFGNPDSAYNALFGWTETDGRLVLYLSSAGSSWNIANAVTIIPASLSTAQWYHVAITRYGNTFRTFCNGNQQATFTSSASIYQPSNQVCFGRYATGYNINAYIDDFRFTKGISRYNYNFIPPTAAYPDY